MHKPNRGKLVLLAVAVLACAAAAPYVTPRVKERMAVTAVQAQCLAFVQPADRMAYLWGMPRRVPACYAAFASSVTTADRRYRGDTGFQPVRATRE